MKLYLRLLSYVKPYLPRFALAIVCIIMAACGNLFIPWIIKDVIDSVLANKDRAMLNIITGLILVVIMLRGVFFYGQTYLISYIGQRVVIDIREEIYRHFQRLSLSYFEKRRTGAVMSHITNDVGAVQSAIVTTVVEMITEIMVLTGSIAAILYIHWKLALLTFITLPLVAQAINIFGKRLRNASRIIQERAADITAILQETLSSVRVVKSFVREEYEIGRFKQENFRNFRASMKAAQLGALLTPLIEFLAAIGVTTIVWYGGREVIEGNLTSGSLIAFLMYVVNISNPIKRIGRGYATIQGALAAAQRFFDVLDTEPDVQDMKDAKKLPEVLGLVKFENVCFSYNPSEPILNNISLTAQPGQMIALVGSSGAGKTTIANLIPRFYNVDSGRITIDGYDISTVTMNSLREQIGIVPQETVLFNTTIYENIRYGDLTASPEQVKAAAEAANAHNFIIDLPNGYDTHIGERGAQISGGQRQRLAIARALLKNPRVLILDEATSALDTESERLVQDALDKLMVGRTSFVIAHRLSTIVRADLILVMEKGEIVERGTHTELLAQGKIYSKLHQMQILHKQ